MTDLIDHLNAVHRRVGRGRLPVGEGRTVGLRRLYVASIEDVWDAITNADRISRWFLPVTGDLRPGGRYQLQGNAGGEVLRCEPPHALKVTWVFGDGDPSEVEVRLSTGTDGATVLELEHTAIVDAERWSEYGPGAVGVGWDLTLLGLGLYLSGAAIEGPDREAWGMSDEARTFMTESASAWGAAHEESGATPEEAATAAKNTREFYVPQP